jgi:hypothetical protein
MVADAIEGAPFGFLLLDERGSITYANLFARQVLDCSRTGDALMDLLDRRHWVSVAADIASLSAGGTDRTRRQIRLAGAQSDQFVLSLALRPAMIGPGQSFCMIGLIECDRDPFPRRSRPGEHVDLTTLLVTVAELGQASPERVARNLGAHPDALTRAWWKAIRLGLLERTDYDRHSHEWLHELTEAGLARTE